MPAVLRNGAAARAAWLPWAVYALVLAGAPFVWRSGLGLTMLSQIGIAIVACLAFNILFGQGGMVSFGHAVYSGLGAYAAIHALRAIGEGAWALPVSLVPLVGGAAGFAVAVVLGAVTTRRAGTTFAMITLGIGELVAALAPMFPGVFGGEGGVTANRVVGAPVLGITFGPQRELYFLIAAYTFGCTLAMYAFTRTPLGRLLNAVRDNPERVEFIGQSAPRVRYLAVIASGLFSGIAGGLAALNFEIVTAETLGAARSGALLLFTFLGGATVFFGPIVGAVLMVVAQVLLSEWTKAWLLYLGLLFLVMVMVAPGGVASVVLAARRGIARGRGAVLAAGGLALAGSALAMLAGAAVLVEMVYHRQLDAALSSQLRVLGVALDVHRVDPWCGALLVALTGAGLFELTRRRFVAEWAGEGRET